MIQLLNNMSVDALLLIFYVLLALITSFLCSVAEAVLLSITPSYIENQKQKRPEYAALLKQLRQDGVDQSLAAILTLNTIAHTVGAIGAGAKATIVFGSAWFGLFSAVMTLMILFLSEIIPKTIGAIYWKKFVRLTAYFVKGLIVTLYPIVWIAESVTKFISQGKTIHLFNRDEFVAMSRIGEKTGHISNNEVRIIRNLFRFDSLKVTDIMTPRVVIGSLPEDTTVTEASEYAERVRFSRLLIHKGDTDTVSGYVLRNDIFLSKAKGQGNETLKTFRHDLLAVPEQLSLTRLLEQFLENRQYIAIVIDEYGGTAGLVTLEDLVETLIGIEIMDETDEIANLRTLARKKWKERAKEFGINVESSEPSTPEQGAPADSDEPHH